MDQTADGRSFRMLTIVDELTRECPAIDVAKKLTSEDVLERLSDLFVRRGVPEHIRSDNGKTMQAGYTDACWSGALPGYVARWLTKETQQ